MATLRQHVAENRKRILAREAVIAGAITAAFQHARATLSPAQAALLTAYTNEQQRLQAEQDAEAEDDGVDPDELPPVRVPPSRLVSSPEYRHYERLVLATLATFAVASRLHIMAGQQQAVAEGARDAHRLITAALEPLTVHLSMDVGLMAHRVPLGVLDAFVGRSTTTGKPLAALLDTLGEATATRVRQTMLAALAAGSHPSVAARQLVDVTGMAYRRALTISRTELIGAWRDAAHANFRANADVLQGWRWLTGPSPCPFCASMADTEHTLDEELSSHPNCVCTPSPITKPLSDILSMFAA